MARFGSRRRENQVARRRPDGRFDMVLDPGLRASIGALLGELQGLIEAEPNDPGLRRLNPPAYLDDQDRDTEYQLLAGDELRTRRSDTIDAVRESLDASDLGEDDLWGWLQALNALRLVVGTRLDISEDDHRQPVIDPEDPSAPLWSIYDFATWTQHEVILALRS